MSNTDFGKPDVIVVGAGNAACCAALAAREGGASVIMLEAAPVEDSGGGLGLWVTYQIVHQLKGTIDVSSAVPETRFVVNLPVAMAS